MVFTTYSCEPSANFLVCGGLTSENEPLLAYYRKVDEARPYMTFSLYSERSTVPIDPTSAFVIQNYANDIMGYVSPKSLTVRNIKLKNLGQIWLVIITIAVSLWVIALLCVRVVDKKYCQRGREGNYKYKADEIKALLGVLYSKPLNNMNFEPSSRTKKDGNAPD